MPTQSRREFFRTTTTAATSALLAGPWRALAADAPSPSFKGNDVVPLGRTGLKVSRLAQGTGFNGYNHSSEHTRMGKEKFDFLLRHSLDQGIRFLDMADLYGSHEFVKEVLKGLPRDRFVYLSKIWPHRDTWVTPSGGAKAEVDRFRRELGVDTLDICLIHCMQNEKWVEEFERVRDELSQLKQSQAVRAVGVSCHHFGALKIAATHPWVDVIFARINHKGGAEYSCDGTAAEVAAVLKTARANGKAVVGMKIFGAGKLVKPDEKDASLNYVLRNNLVDAITVGMLKTEEVDDTLERMGSVRAA